MTLKADPQQLRPTGEPSTAVLLAVRYARRFFNQDTALGEALAVVFDAATRYAESFEQVPGVVSATEQEGHDLYYCQSHQATSWTPNGCWVELMGPEPCRLVSARLVVLLKGDPE